MTDKLRVVLTGGGTGGHVFPALAVARQLRELAGPIELLWIGQAGSLEQRTAETEGIAFASVQVGKLRRDRNPLAMLNRANLTDLGRVPVGALQAIRAVAGFKPDVVLATGGFVALPVGLAARLLRVPLVVHEQTVGLGLANRVLAKGAARIALTAEASIALLGPRLRARAIVTGNPVRASILGGEPARARTQLGTGFDPGLPTVYVTGGAQGSREINSVVAELLPWMLMRSNVIHQAGPSNVEALSVAVAGLPAELSARYHLCGFVSGDLVADVLALADVVISRSGAGTLAELTAVGRAAVLLPLASSAGGEQAKAARLLSESGAAVTVSEGITAEAVQAAVELLLADPARREAIAARARKLGRPDAAAALTDVVVQAAGAVPAARR
ncbi:UDP-N-acetylglucosamine--N-acetylmuramyl-(pentapeptide) pyrophosphoryl-undecaprenol N-acetylglucosamine transferase [Nocardia bhagyanarayanae]|uniref:UDP-N-acetylglucosamine--N-acetylmuramyl-(pentapeptide) pyrophosphoryl-undecaprenol N-acetylglucosamine transferase n=1 Tax=Nocardia bhagyanarayanae TaxID=1215925 RepID=A0A543FG23_9NOCA|nr:UDP-N-acetylglucosamine--N-acetylmuramyl-(pentapeptide) pyrophosphoryl-undecaprenol N-acetylglucosamine transferase [Nocardia bhagyanarayanae]TQM32706.1 UDP-N-acetylglucosamine-N-acetylmuramylpentapeptide N-acetylglucosamine transferase [Nocardia bhagyanarayanae]